MRIPLQSNECRARSSARRRGAAAAGLTAMLMLMVPSSAMAQPTWGQLIDMRTITPAERAHWPEYCPHTQTYHEGGGATYQRWIDRLGMGFSAMHHYCWGVIKAYRASAMTAQNQFRNGLLADAIREIEYVDQNIPQDFLLRPEVMLRGGQWSAKLDDQVRAFQFFEASIRAKPDYWPAYLEMANLNLSLKRRQEAIDTLKRGLEQAPGQTALTAALARIETDPALGTQRAQRPAR